MFVQLIYRSTISCVAGECDQDVRWIQQSAVHLITKLDVLQQQTVRIIGSNVSVTPEGEFRFVEQLDFGPEEWDLSPAAVEWSATGNLRARN
jgi:hypothetical protein